MNEAKTNSGESTIPPQVQEQTIAALADELQADIDQVRHLYHSTRARLESNATIKTYVSVIAVRLVREAFARTPASFQ